jgi:hypothetical protein
MRAYSDLEADKCGGCGGLLSETLETDHGYSVETVTCQKCRAHEVWRQSKAASDEALHGTGLDPAPGRMVFSKRVEMPGPV